jgi:UDP-GlcNAc3NAcA epimerase
MKIISLIGTRPQYIKEAVLGKELTKQGIKEILVDSGQHYDNNMSDVFLKTLDIKKPEYNLRIGSDTHAQMTARIIIGFEKIVLKEKPKLILVYGDTNTTLAGALVGSKLNIPIAHVEAGLRCLPKNAPEEINRVITDHISTLLFCPSQLAVNNLKKENITKGVYFTGDVMYDLFLKMKPYFNKTIVNKLGLENNNYIVLTIHRTFNVDNKKKLKAILVQINKISKTVKVVFPIHPRTKKRVHKFRLEKLLKNLTLIEPLDYLNLMGLVQQSRLVITDSGGLQKEAYFANKRALVIMPDTGWRELVLYKYNVLVNELTLFSTYINLRKIQIKSNLYGLGNTSSRIVNLLHRF